MINVGIIGLGVGEAHLQSYLSNPNCKVLKICDFNSSKLLNVGDKYPTLNLVSNPNEVLDDPDIDIVSIASYDDFHYEQILRALENNKHVFAEKPICLNKSELSHIYQLWKKKGNLRFSTNTVLRASPRFNEVKQLIKTNKIGDVYSIEAEYSYGRIEKLISENAWRGKIPGYSVILGGGIHIADLILWILDELPEEVFAYGSNMATKDTNFREDDFVTSLLKFKSGTIAKLSANFACVHPHFHRLLVYGTLGTFENTPEFPSESGRLWDSRDPLIPPTPVMSSYSSLNKGIMIPKFVDAVLGIGEPIIGEIEVFNAILVSLAIEDSRKLGIPIKIDYNKFFK